ncbi:hypothetical protein KIW84_041528 [Lathyrus oleraceus]|uniref:Exocyst complex subunit Exo70 C-terminal domain-containing protein n=1 Tax=Pisum sativum TaxID=3888 RepID=A0A9D4XA37_PEA|nr:hypothetical protein KIW84_041528 [Pisum sativum]
MSRRVSSLIEITPLQRMEREGFAGLVCDDGRIVDPVVVFPGKLLERRRHDGDLFEVDAVNDFDGERRRCPIFQTKREIPLFSPKKNSIFLLLSAYRKFIGRFQSLAGVGKNTDKYVKYETEDIEV